MSNLISTSGLFFLYFAFLSDLYWLAHQTESERQLAHDTVFFQRKTSPLLRRWTHQTFPDIFFFSPDCPSLSLSDGSLSLNRQFCSVCSACIYGAKNFHYNDQVMNILLLFKRKTHRLRLPLRWAPKREARPPAALISASVGILWEPKTTKHFDIVHTRLLIDSIPVQNRKFFLFWFLLLSSSKWTGSGEIVKRPRNRVAIVRDYDAVCWRMAGPMKREDEWR